MEDFNPEQEQAILSFTEGWLPAFKKLPLESKLNIKKILAAYDALEPDADNIKSEYRRSIADKKRVCFNHLSQKNHIQRNAINALAGMAPITAIAALGPICGTLLTQLETGHATPDTLANGYLSICSMRETIKQARIAHVSLPVPDQQLVKNVMPPDEFVDRILEIYKVIIGGDPEVSAEYLRSCDLELLMGDMRMFLSELNQNLAGEDTPFSYREDPECVLGYRAYMKRCMEATTLH